MITGNHTTDFDLEGATKNSIVGNNFGLAADGLTRLALAGPGISLDSKCSNNTIGGTGRPGRNLIAGNLNSGIELDGASNNQILNNYIGLDKNGNKQGNHENGILVQDGASGNTIGSTTAGTGNVISGNSVSGVALTGTGTSKNSVAGNIIGMDPLGKSEIGNQNGVTIDNGASGNTIGGTAAGALNVISGNADNGVEISDPGTGNNVIAGDYIGTDAMGKTAFGNGQNGVDISNAGNNTVGAAAPAQGPDTTVTVISGNGFCGVYIETGNYNLIQNCYIGTDVSGTIAVGNRSGGISVQAYSSSNTIGGLQPGTRNIISGNGTGNPNPTGPYGIVLWSGANNNLIENNYIGTDVSGTLPLGNDGDGIYILSNNNTVGGQAVGAENVISANGGNGVDITKGSNNQIVDNAIGVNPDGTNNTALMDGAGAVNDEGVGNVFEGNEEQP